MTAAETPPDGPLPPALVPPGVPVRSGRLTLGRLRSCLPSCGEPVRLLAGFRTICWLGGPSDTPPDLGPTAYRTSTTIDARNRLRLDRHAVGWLAVADRLSFDAVVMASPSSGGSSRSRTS